jgi:hypothetical protein
MGKRTSHNIYKSTLAYSPQSADIKEREVR